MSSQIMKRSYTIIAVRGTGVAMEIDTMASYQDALTCAKEANENKNNVEVRIIENKYDEATKKDKKTLVKLLNIQNSDILFILSTIILSPIAMLFLVVKYLKTPILVLKKKIIY